MRDIFQKCKDKEKSQTKLPNNFSLSSFLLSTPFCSCQISWAEVYRLCCFAANLSDQPAFSECCTAPTSPSFYLQPCHPHAPFHSCQGAPRRAFNDQTAERCVWSTIGISSKPPYHTVEVSKEPNLPGQESFRKVGFGHDYLTQFLFHVRYE